MFKAIPLSIFALFLLWATCNAAETGVSAVSLPAITSATTPSPDFESLRIKGLNIALPGPQDTIDPDFQHSFKSRLSRDRIHRLEQQ